MHLLHTVSEAGIEYVEVALWTGHEHFSILGIIIDLESMEAKDKTVKLGSSAQDMSNFPLLICHLSENAATRTVTLLILTLQLII